MAGEGSAVEHPPGEPQRGFIAWWHRTPLYLRIIGALILGVLTAVVLSPKALPIPGIPFRDEYGALICADLELPSRLILRLLGALAPPLILIAVIQALMNARLQGGNTKRLIGLLATNTLVAICIGLLVANVVRPGQWAKLTPKEQKPVAEAVDPSLQPMLDVLAAHGYKSNVDIADAAVIGDRLKAARETRGLAPEAAADHVRISPADLAAIESGQRKAKEGELVGLARLYKMDVLELIAKPKDAWGQFLDNVPKSLLGPLGDNGSVLSVIFIAVAFGVALRRVKDEPIHTLGDLVSLAFNSMLVVLHWVIDVIPLGVFGIVASIVGTKGFGDFVALGAFIVAVILALALHAAYYLTRVKLGSWVRPLDLIRGTRDALVMAFSTASSTATMPVTYSCLRDRVGLRKESASMGALVGANFNNDGTALYEAMSALFIAQLLGLNLDLQQQFLVVITSVLASVGAAGIPEAGLVTMTLVFNAVGLPTPYIALLLTVDWFLDRCRTTINVMGDMNVSCLLDGKQREAAEAPAKADLAGAASEPAAE